MIQKSLIESKQSYTKKQKHSRTAFTFQLRKLFRLGKLVACKNKFYNIISDNPQHKINNLTYLTSL